jgi:beta-glucosidase
MKIKLQFPENFLWGSATASYQVEGGIENNDWAKAGREGKVPEAGLSSDHYNKYESDFDLARNLGHNSHRFSVEWSRIEPVEGKYDMKEIEHYRAVLQALHDRGLKPFVTLWHFTLPLWFSESGGFARRKNVEKFARYCAFVTEQLGDLAEHFTTMNEPMVVAGIGNHRGKWPPFKKSKLATFVYVNNLIRAHNLAYKKIKSAPKNQGRDLKIDLVKHNINFVGDGKPWNKIAASLARWYWNHRFLKKTIKNCDAIGLNYYTSRHFGKQPNVPKNDMGWNLEPAGLFYVLKELKKYKKPIYITEAGLADEKDRYRAKYIIGLVKAMHSAIQEGVDLRGYMYWSLLDNFEWAEGYWPRFGLIEIDYKTGARRVRNSAYVYKKICDDNALTVE